MYLLQNLFGQSSVRSYKVGVVSNNWLVGNAVFSDFLHEVREYKGRKVTEPDFWKKKKNFLIWRIRKKVCKLAHQTNTLIFFSKTAGTIFLVFGLKLVLNMTFNLNETYFSEKIAIWRYLTSKSSKKITQNEVSGHFLDFASLVFLDFADNDRWSWCLVVLLQFTGPFNVFFLPFRIINV